MKRYLHGIWDLLVGYGVIYAAAVLLGWAAISALADWLTGVMYAFMYL